MTSCGVYKLNLATKQKTFICRYMRVVLLLSLMLASCLFGVSKHRRDGLDLPKKEQEFAGKLSLRMRKVFCGRFNHKQRQMAIKMARGRGHDRCLTPDEAVVRVMEETGMSLAVKGQSETDHSRK